MFKYGIISYDEIFWFPDFETALHDFTISVQQTQQLFDAGLLTDDYTFQFMPQLIREKID